MYFVILKKIWEAGSKLNSVCYGALPCGAMWDSLYVYFIQTNWYTAFKWNLIGTSLAQPISTFEPGDSSSLLSTFPGSDNSHTATMPLNSNPHGLMTMFSRRTSSSPKTEETIELKEIPNAIGVKRHNENSAISKSTPILADTVVDEKDSEAQRDLDQTASKIDENEHEENACTSRSDEVAVRSCSYSNVQSDLYNNPCYDRFIMPKSLLSKSGAIGNISSGTLSHVMLSY